MRFGRMPKTEREKLMADKEELSNTSGKRIVELRSLTDLIKAAFRDVFQKTVFFAPHETVLAGTGSTCPGSTCPGMPNPAFPMDTSVR